MDIQQIIHDIWGGDNELSPEERVAIEKALREQAEREKGCQWRQEDEDNNDWECSACGMAFFFEDGGPFENEMHFCPGCGKPIKSITFREYDAENDEMVDRAVLADGQKSEG